MESASRNQEIVAENLTHAVTPGYRRQALTFEVPDYSANADDRGTRNAGRGGSPGAFTHYESGPIEQTQNPLDVALVGDAFFVVEGPNGPLYTRNGGFELNAAGQLQTRGGGYRVRGRGGPITLPTNATQIAISTEGTISANGVEVGRLDFATFARPDTLRRVGGTLFEGGGPETPPPGTVRVEQGYREGSNVQPVQEMVSMMLGMRFYEAAEKAMRAISDAVAQNTRTQS
jgi:flagellar basal body rod protein FlgG